jgi:hypothetical protein
LRAGKGRGLLYPCKSRRQFQPRRVGRAGVGADDVVRRRCTHVVPGAYIGVAQRLHLLLGRRYRGAGTPRAPQMQMRGMVLIDLMVLCALCGVDTGLPPLGESDGWVGE